MDFSTLIICMQMEAANYKEVLSIYWDRSRGPLPADTAPEIWVVPWWIYSAVYFFLKKNTKSF